MTGNRALIVAADAVVLDEVLRLAAVANCETERVLDLFDARARWKEAPLVLIDEAALAEDEPVNLPSRKGVLVVCKGTPEPSTWQRAFAVGAQQVHSLPDDEIAVLTAFADLVDGPPHPGGRVVTVTGGCGGAGATLLAAALATAATHDGNRTLLLDCDPLSGGLDLLLGNKHQQGAHWPDLRVGSGRILLSALETSLPHHDCTPTTLPTRFLRHPSTPKSPRRSLFPFLSTTLPSNNPTPSLVANSPLHPNEPHSAIPTPGLPPSNRHTTPPNTDRHLSSPNADRYSSAPNTDRHSSSPGADRHSSSPGADRHSSSPGADRRSSSTNADRRLSSPGAAGHPPAHAADRYIPPPSANRRIPPLGTARGTPPLNGEAIASVVDAARRAGRFVICDLPRHLGNGSAEAAARADLALVVVPLDFRACAAAKRVVDLLRGTGAEIRLVARGPARSGPSAAQVATTLGVPLLGEYRQEPRLTRGGAFHPKPGGRLLTVAASALAALPRQEIAP